MASIQFNFNIMSHPGRTERKEEASSQEKEEDGKREQDLYQPRSLFPNRIQQAPRSELFMSTNAYGLVGQASFRGNDGATRNVDYTQRLHNNPSNEFLGPGLGFENREFTAIGDSFELDDFNLGIDENEPTPNFPVARNLQGSNESRAFPPQRMPPENITGEGRAQDEGMDRKPAAMDPTLHPNLQQLRNQHQQYYHPNQQAMHPLELFFNTSMNRPLQNQQAQREVAEQIALPVASLTRGSAKAPRRTKRNLKPPPEASFPRQSPRRSKRITANSTRKKASPKKSPDKKKASPKRAQPRTLQVKQWSETRKAILQEARTQRQSDALHTWFERLGDLQEFIDEQGHANVPQKYPQNHSLACWVNKMRMEKKKYAAGDDSSSLTADKIELLEKVGFVWAKVKGKDAWEERFREINDYREKHGHANVPTKNKANRALGRWVSSQRANYKAWKEGKYGRIDPEEIERRIKRLEAIGFAWSLLPGGTTTEVDHGEDEEEEEEENSDMETDSSSS